MSLRFIRSNMRCRPGRDRIGNVEEGVEEDVEEEEEDVVVEVGVITPAVLPISIERDKSDANVGASGIDTLEVERMRGTVEVDKESSVISELSSSTSTSNSSSSLSSLSSCSTWSLLSSNLLTTSFFSSLV